VVNVNIVGALGTQSLREIAGFVPRTQPHVGVRKNALQAKNMGTERLSPQHLHANGPLSMRCRNSQQSGKFTSELRNDAPRCSIDQARDPHAKNQLISPVKSS
jgi:hypothetical protein